MDRNKAEKRMATAPVGRLMLQMGTPMILSMMLQAVYNIVDSYFVANMAENGEIAVNALTLAFPVQMMMVAAGIGTGVGANALIARALGQGDREKAGAAAGNAMTLMGIIYAVCLLFGAFGAGAYIGSQTSDPIALAMGSQYLRICCMASFGILFFSVFEKTLQATGRSLYSTIAQVAGALTNIVLDPIMIYGLLGCPKLGVAGAAWATVLGQIASLALAAVFHFRLNRELPFRRKALRLRRSIVGEIYSIGVPAILNLALPSVLITFLNSLLAVYSQSYVVVLGIYYKLQTFLYLPANGIVQGLRPIIGYNYGAGEYDRVKKLYRTSMGMCAAIMAAGTVLCLALSGQLIGLFSSNAETIAIGTSALRIICVGFIVSTISVVASGSLEGLGMGVQSLVISLCRYIVVIMPLAWLFCRLLGADGIWNAFWVTEVITAGISLVVYHKSVKLK